MSVQETLRRLRPRCARDDQAGSAGSRWSCRAFSSPSWSATATSARARGAGRRRDAAGAARRRPTCRRRRPARRPDPRPRLDLRLRGHRDRRRAERRPRRRGRAARRAAGPAARRRRARRLLRRSPGPTAPGRCGPATRPGSGSPRSSGARCTCSGRHDRLIAGIARWLLAHRHRRSRVARLRARPRRAGRLVGLDGAQPRGARRSSPGSTPRFAGRPVDPALGRPASPASTGSRPRRAHALAADARERGRAHRPRDRRRAVRPRRRRRVPAPGTRRRRAAARRAGARHPLAARARPPRRRAWRSSARTDATMRGRRAAASTGPARRGRRSTATARPSSRGPDVLWMEGTLMMRLAKARLGSDVAALDDDTDRWAALTRPRPAAARRSRGGRGLPRVARGGAPRRGARSAAAASRCSR